MRTTNNILGDCYAAAVVEHWSQEELKNMKDFLPTLNPLGPGPEDNKIPYIDADSSC